MFLISEQKAKMFIIEHKKTIITLRKTEIFLTITDGRNKREYNDNNKIEDIKLCLKFLVNI